MNDTPDISPETPERTDLITLTQDQADRVTASMRAVHEAQRVLDERQEILNGLLAMVQPLGATGFDVETMSFYSEPSAMPEDEPKE